jgi:hypothetical protein
MACQSEEDEMTPEELKYYTALQPVFRLRMGGLKIHDQFWCPRYTRYTNEFLCKEWDCRKGYVDRCEGIESCALRIPLPIDPGNPERGCWGMIDSYKKELHTWRSGRSIVELVDKEGVRKIYEDRNPTLALLKALAVQGRIKI